MSYASTASLEAHYPILRKASLSSLPIPPYMIDYEAMAQTYTWETTANELRLPRANGYNKATVCIDDHPPEVMQRTALIWHSAKDQIETYTFADLKRKTSQTAHLLTRLGIKPGDRVFIFLERIPELYIVLFAALKVQAIAGPLFAAFGPEAIKDRVQDCGACLIVTSPALKPRIDAILGDCPSVQRVVIVDREGGYTQPQPHETLYHPSVATLPDTFEVSYTDKDTSSIIHYTSGTTGKPKGAVHRHYAMVSQAATAKYVLDLHPEQDIYWCTADPGWVTGTSYGMFGPWAWGTTQVVYEGSFKADNWYRIIQEHRVSVWYTAPTAIRMLMKAGEAVAEKYDFSSLRHLLSVGEPLNPEAVMWGRQVFGHVFHDTWWQTETGCMHICNYPCMDVKPGSMGKPHPGVMAAILDDEWNPLPPGEEGHLAIRPDAPSMLQTYWNRHEMYESKLKNGWYITGDRASVDADGYFWFFGRSDDVINTAGHLVGPFEVESALIQHPAVAEAGVIGKPDPERMEVVKAFVSLKAGYMPSDELKEDIQQFVRSVLAAHAYPREITFLESLPKTRSGKIMRRLLKARELGLPEGDTSPVVD
jgi:acetyl-CoA synthetase